LLSYNIDFIVSINFTEGFSSRSSKDPVILPTAPRAARGPGIDEENIPTNPPYVAYISNLPYDVDETDLADFFADMKVCYFCKYIILSSIFQDHNITFSKQYIIMIYNI
jgi:hypothetical protein